MTTKTLADRGDRHLARQIWHFAGVMSMFALYLLTSRATTMHFAYIMTGFLVTLDLLRLRFQGLNQRLIWIFQPVLREREKSRLTGTTFMLLGVTIAGLIFPREVTLLMLLFFSMADPLAAFVGTRYGKDKLIGNKSLQGSLAAFGVCFVLTLVYCIAFHTMTERLVLVAAVCGLIGSVSELAPIGNLDDNFVFPVLSSALLTLAFRLFGGL